MPHYRLMYPSEFLNAADLRDKDCNVEIESVKIEEVPDTSGKKVNKPVIRFKGKEKRLPLPKTCARIIAALHGKNTDDWVGKKVTLYPTECSAFGQTVECIRVRPTAP